MSDFYENRPGWKRLQNVWGVEETDANYSFRFRNDDSFGGWAKAFIPKGLAVHMEQGNKKNMYNFAFEHDINVKIRIFENADKKYHVEECRASELKRLYNESRKLVKADKEKAGRGITVDADLGLQSDVAVSAERDLNF